MADIIIVDIWGGEKSQDHVARFLRPIPEALVIAGTEIANGFLVNLRKDAHFGIQQDWDKRHGTCN